MNKKILFIFSIVLLFSASAFSKKVTITTQSSSFVFSPDSVSIVVGDTIAFSGSSFHPVVEVSQATWNASGTTSNGGFSFPSGSGNFAPTSAGVYYFVCGNHGTSFGMKGRIFVGVASGVALNENLFASPVSVYPNPANDFINISYKVPYSSAVSVSVFNILGKEVLSLFKGTQAAGTYDKQFKLGDLTAGVYFVKATTVNREFITKLIVQ